MQAIVEKDQIGLFVVHDSWVSRPIAPTPFKQGDQVDVEQLVGVSVSICKAGDNSTRDIFLRCGMHTASVKRSQDNFDFFQGMKEDVLRAKADIAVGVAPQSAGAEQHTLVTPNVAKAVRMRP